MKMKIHYHCHNLLKHLAISLFMTALALSGLRAAQFERTEKYTQPNGAEIEVWGRGNDYSAVFEHNGYTVVYDGARKGWFYATLSADKKELLPGALMPGRDDPKKAGLPLHLNLPEETRRAQIHERRQKLDGESGRAELWRQLKDHHRQRERGRRAGLETTSPSADDSGGVGMQAVGVTPGVQTTGNILGLTLIVNFSDIKSTVKLDDLKTMLNGNGTTVFGNKYSVRDYYYHASNGKLTYTNLVYEVTVPYSYDHYHQGGKDSGTKDSEAAQKLIVDAVEALKNLPNYNSEILPALKTLTTVGDTIKGFNILYAGGGPQGKDWSYGLWPHQWHNLYFKNNVNLGAGAPKIYDYQISNILQEGTTPDGIGTPIIGTFVHESGHLLFGFPDFYEYDDAAVGEGVGDWCVMNSGDHNDGSKNPAQPCAYLKYVAGWATAEDVSLTSQFTGTLTARYGSSRYNQFYRFPKPGSDVEYFLVENRQQTDSDEHLPGAGILIWHVNENGDNTDWNEWDDRSHDELYLVEADGSDDMPRGLDYGSATDPWFSGNTASGYTNRFSGTRTNWWNNHAPSGIELSNFSASDDTMTFTSETSSALRTSLSGPVSVTAGNNATFTATINGGYSPYKFQWYDNDELKKETTTGVTTLALSYVGARTISVRVIDAAGQVATAQCTVTVSANPDAATLAAALDNDLTWTTGGNTDWFSQKSVTHDGISAAQSGAITHNGSTVLQTTVSGPGKVYFWWKVSSEAGYDFLRFYVDGVERARISGERNWAQREFTVSGSGNHVLKWVYDKDFSISSGSDAGWVDQVVWTPGGVVTPALTVTPENKSVAATASSFSVSVTSNIAWTMSKDAAWLTVTPATGNSSGALTIRVAANSGAARTGKVTVSGGGIARTVTVTQAADRWDVAGLASKGVKLTAPAVPAGVKVKGKIWYVWYRDGHLFESGYGKKTMTVKQSGVYAVEMRYATSTSYADTTHNFGIVKMFAQPKTATLALAQTTNTITNSALRGTSVVSGETLRLTVSVSTGGGGATGPFRYVWYCGGAVVRTQESTSTTDSFTTPAYGDKTVGYKCVVELVARDAKSKPLATVKSKELKAKVILPPSAVFITPNSPALTVLKTLTLTANAKGTAKLYYTWFKDGRKIGVTSTNKKLVIKDVWFENAGQYYVVVTQDNTNRRVQSAAVTVRVQFSDGTVLGDNAAPQTTTPQSPSAAASSADDQRRQDAAGTLSNSAGASVLNLAPLSLSAGDVLTVSGSATREYIIVSETQHTTGAYRYEWRDNLTAEFQDAEAAEVQLTLHFITTDGGVYELSVSGSVGETGVFELRKK